MFEKAKAFFKKSADSITWLYKADHGQTLAGWSKSRGLNLYETFLYLNRAINKRADKVGEIKFILKRSANPDGPEIENEWTELLRRPNPEQTSTQFFKLYGKYKDIFGEAYILKVGVDETSEPVFKKTKVPSALRLLRPDLVEKHYNADRTEITGFTHTSESGSQEFYTPDQVIYLYNPDPRHQLEGESLIRAGLRNAQLGVDTAENQAMTMKTGGKVDTVIKVKNSLTAEQLKELKKQFRESQLEAKDSGLADEPMFASGDMDILRLQLNPQELNYLESRKMTIDDMVALTGVPKTLLGITSDETFANADAAIRVFLRETIKPLIAELTDVLNWKLIPEEFELTFVDPTPEDREQKRADLQAASNSYAITTNEKRKMLGLPPVKNGDEILIPMNLIPYQNNQSSSSSSEAEKSANPKKKFLSDEARKQYGEAYVKKLDDETSKVKRAVDKIFEDQRKRIVRYVEKSLRSKSVIDDAFNMEVEVTISKNGILPIIRDLFIASGKEYLEYWQTGVEFNYTSTVATTLELRAELFAQSINKTTFEKLLSEFKTSAELNETRNELVNRINAVYEDISQKRAEVIARTETHVALQSGIDEAAHQAGFKIKIWVWGVGVKGGIRDHHQAIDGEERPINTPFSIGLMYPGDGGPAESINCQCTRV